MNDETTKEELSDKILDLVGIQSQISMIEDNQNEALKEYDGFPDSITVLGEERDISNLLRDEVLSNRVVGLFKDIPEAMDAINDFLGMEVGRDQLESDALSIQGDIDNLNIGMNVGAPTRVDVPSM